MNNINAGETIERIGRGHFRLAIITHGDQMQHREVQLWDTVNNLMVKAVGEESLIASMLLDPRTAVKHFGETSAKKELEEVLAPKEDGFQRILRENPNKTAVKGKRKGLGFTLRLSERIEDRLAREETQRRAPAVITEAMLEKSPEELASQFEFTDGDARGLFMALCTAFGVARVGKFLSDRDPGGTLDLTWVSAMGEDLSQEANVQEVEEKKAAEEKQDFKGAVPITPESAAVFNPSKS